MIQIERDLTQARGPRPSVSAVIMERKRILLQQRSDGGQWGLPGGSVELGERVTDALIREVKEETGLPATLLPNHRIRIRDALSARRTPFIR